MKEELIEILKNHVKDHKLDEFAIFIIMSLYISTNQKLLNTLKEVFKELGIKENKNNE